jgi:TfoX/Sxy family transcriptional regulator of competence genes
MNFELNCTSPQNTTMKWEKPGQALIETFHNSLPVDDRIDRKSMFGMPCAFVNGNMFCGVFLRGIMVRLSEDQREHWIRERKAKLFEPMPGRPMKEYIEPPPSVLQDPVQLGALVRESFQYALTLKPKQKKKPAAGKKANAANKRSKKG